MRLYGSALALAFTLLIGHRPPTSACRVPSRTRCMCHRVKREKQLQERLLLPECAVRNAHYRAAKLWRRCPGAVPQAWSLYACCFPQPQTRPACESATVQQLILCSITNCSTLFNVPLLKLAWVCRLTGELYSAHGCCTCPTTACCCGEPNLSTR